MNYKEMLKSEKTLRDRIYNVDPDSVSVSVKDLKDGYFSISIFDLDSKHEFSLVVAKAKSVEKAESLAREMKDRFIEKHKIKKHQERTNPFFVAQRKAKPKKKKQRYRAF